MSPVGELNTKYPLYHPYADLTHTLYLILEIQWSSNGWRMFWDSGFSRQDLADLFTALPPRLLAVVKDLCGAIDFFIYVQDLTRNKNR